MGLEDMDRELQLEMEKVMEMEMLRWLLSEGSGV